MKLYTETISKEMLSVAGNGTRLKDFVDLAFLGSRITTNEMIYAYFR